MFFIPKNPLGPYPSESLLDWSVVQSKLAWGVILLRGGGFSMANTATVTSVHLLSYFLTCLIDTQSSGLTKMIGEQLGPLRQYPVPVIVTVVSLLASFTTELASNSAIATIFLPISGQIVSAIVPQFKCHCH